MSAAAMKSMWRLPAGCLVCGIAAGPAALAADLRIGFLAPTTGIYSQVGKDMVNGFQMYLDEVGGDFAGAKVNFIVEDEEGKPPVAIRKVEKLIRQDNVQMFVGGLLASTGYALAPVSTRLKTVYVASIPAADDLTPDEMRRRAVDRNLTAATFFRRDRVRRKPCAIGDVEHIHLLMRQNARRLEQHRVNGDRAVIVQIRARAHAAVDLAFHHGEDHSRSPCITSSTGAAIS